MDVSSRQNILMIFLALLAGTLSADAAEIRFRQATVPTGALVLLRDVAEIDSESPTEIAQLGRIELFPAPDSHDTKIVRSIEVRQLLQLHGVEARIHRYSGASAVRIHGRSTEASLALAPIKPSIHSVSRPSPKAGTVPGKMPADLAERTETMPLVLTRRNIAAGEVIREIDVELVRPEQPQRGTNWAMTIEAVAGREALRAISAGQPIDSRSIRRPIMIQRGQLVLVSARISGVTASTTARALEAGSIGDLIQLESLESHQPYTAVVTGSQQAEVLAATQNVATSTAAPAEPRAIPTIRPVVPTARSAARFPEAMELVPPRR